MKRISFWFLSTLSAVVLLFGFDASRHDSSLSATAPITFAVRIGDNGGGALFFNVENDGVTSYGNTYTSSLTVTELAP